MGNGVNCEPDKGAVLSDGGGFLLMKLTASAALGFWLFLQIFVSIPILISGQVSRESVERDNQEAHIRLIRELGDVGGRLKSTEEYVKELKEAHLRERTARLEVSIDTVIRLMWATLIGVFSLVTKEIYGLYKATLREKRGGRN